MKNRISLLTLFGSIAIVVIVAVITFPKNILSWDTFGYYLYLPQLFIYNDLGINNLDTLQNIVGTYENTATLYQIWQTETGEWLIRYTSGQAILFSPFFGAAHLVALCTDFPADGFSLPYQTGIFAGCLIYFAIALTLLRRILLRFFSDKVTALTIFFLTFGTNLFANSIWAMAGIHSQLFFLYTILLLYTIRWHKRQSWSNILPIAIAAGLIIITRPTDVICLIIPFLWNIYNKDSLREKIGLLIKNIPQLIVCVIIVCAIGSIQMIYWKHFSGHWLIDSYNNPGEGLDFLFPHIWQTLFSFRKGWFIYTPMMLFAMAGFVLIWKRSKQHFLALALFVIANIYLVSCWSCWWYAGSFGQRAYVQSYAVLSIPLGFFIQYSLERKSAQKGILLTILSLCTLLNLFQTWQFRHGIINRSRMTRAAYFTNFFTTDPQKCDDRLLMIHRDASGIETIDTNRNYVEKYLIKKDFGQDGFVTDSLTEFSPALQIPYNKITKKDHAWLRIKATVKQLSDTPSGDAVLVVTFCHKGNYKYRTYPLPSTMAVEEWQEMEIHYLSPEIRTTKDELNVYLWNRSRQPIAIKDIEIWASEEQ